jgi:tetratricopeptide (TPR) repeat protein
MRGSIRRMLVNFGVDRVDTASSGEEAIALCQEFNFDIILADYNLGDGKSGQQILEEMRFKRMLKSTSLYMMITAETTKSMVFGALEYQPDDYLTKPFTQTVLQKRLDRMVLEKEALYEINHAIDQLDFDRAIELCRERIARKDKYERRCHRLMGDCMYKKHKYGQAKSVYEKVLEDRPVEWASIGLGKSLMALGELEQAETIFGDLVQEGSLCLEVYDCLADIKSRRGEAEQAQRLLEDAIEISPNAIMRQQRLAQLCEANHNWVAAQKSYRKIIRLGNNSVYETPEHHFNYARSVAKEMSHSKEKPVEKLKDVQEVLRMAKRKFANHENIELQADIVEAGVMAESGKLAESKNKVEQLQSKLDSSNNRTAELFLDMAKTYKAIGQTEKSQAILADLAEKYANNNEICLAIDAMSDEPITAQGKQKAVTLNKEGKDLFASKEYSKAVQLFGQALLHYPNNTGLNLNLMLALVRKMNSDGPTEQEVSRCQAAKEKLAKLETSSPYYERYHTLCGHLDKLRAKLA